MNSNESLPFAVSLHAHFPKATEEDGRLCWQKLQPYTLATARQAIEEHRLELGARAFRPAPVRLAAICRGIERPGADPAADRTRTYLRDLQAAGQAADAERARIAEALDRLSDEELDRLKAQAVARAHPGVQPMLERSDPRTGTILRSMIYRGLRGEVTA